MSSTQIRYNYDHHDHHHRDGGANIMTLSPIASNKMKRFKWWKYNWNRDYSTRIKCVLSTWKWNKIAIFCRLFSFRPHRPLGLVQESCHGGSRRLCDHSGRDQGQEDQALRYELLCTFWRVFETMVLGSPADKDNLEVGDEILEVNGKTLEDATHTEVINHIHQVGLVWGFLVLLAC